MGRRKRGWNKAAALSLGDLRQLFESKTDALRVRREEVVAELADIDSQLGSEDGEVKRGPGRPRGGARRGRPPKAGRPAKTGRRGRKPGPKGQSDLHNAIRKALSGGGEMKLADIAAAVLKSGYETKSSRFAVIVGQRISEMKDVKKAGHGVYALK